MSHCLDRPVWNALRTTHAGLAEKHGPVLRYPFSVIPFSALHDQAQESYAALANMLQPDEFTVLVEKETITVPDGLKIIKEARLLQMVAARGFDKILDSSVQKLGEDDAADMLELARMTEPGPFTMEAQRLGTFWGVRINGQLVAMAGQRMRQPGFAELSGLCTHPDFQGRGFGKLMLCFVAGELSAKGETIFLHSYADNKRAIGLYQALGFEMRETLNFCVLMRA